MAAVVDRGAVVVAAVTGAASVVAVVAPVAVVGVEVPAARFFSSWMQSARPGVDIWEGGGGQQLTAIRFASSCTSSTCF